MANQVDIEQLKKRRYELSQMVPPVARGLPAVKATNDFIIDLINIIEYQQGETCRSQSSQS